jgi:hypothetical protein
MTSYNYYNNTSTTTTTPGAFIVAPPPLPHNTNNDDDDDQNNLLPPPAIGRPSTSSSSAYLKQQNNYNNSNNNPYPTALIVGGHNPNNTNNVTTSTTNAMNNGGEGGRRMFVTALSAGSSYNNQRTDDNLLPALYVLPPDTSSSRGGSVGFRSVYDRYDALQALVIGDGGISMTKKNSLEEQLLANKTELTRTTEQLRKNRTDQPYLAKRIHRNENPRFFHYMQINRLGKVERLKKEMDQLKLTEQTLLAKEFQLQELIQLQETELQIHIKNINTIATAQNEIKRLFDYIVAASPSPLLIQLNNQHAQLSANLSIEQGLDGQLANTENQIVQAKQLLWRARNDLEAAARENQTAQMVNVMDMGYHHHRQGGYNNNIYYNNDQFTERALQMDRDRRINTARELGYQAGDALRNAVATLPQEARIRYPEITRQIISAPIPELRGSNFGGTMMTGMVFGTVGDMFNDMNAAGKIQQNLQALIVCDQISSQHLALVGELRRRVREQMNQLQIQINSILHNIQGEKLALFERGRLLQ